MKTLDEVLDPYNENRKLEEDTLIKLEQEIFEELINYDIVDLTKHIYNRINGGELDDYCEETISTMYDYIKQMYNYIKSEFIDKDTPWITIDKDNSITLSNIIQNHKETIKNKNLLML